jgi:hypothetical protein
MEMIDAKNLSALSWPRGRAFSSEALDGSIPQLGHYQRLQKPLVHVAFNRPTYILGFRV